MTRIERLGPRAVSVFAFAALASSGAVRAGDCDGLFVSALRPRITNPKLDQRLVPLCFEAFAVLHSGASRTPLYAAERLTSEGVAAARRVDRVDAFHDEDALPAADRARLDDYVRSGFDRGHMAPAGDMPTGTAQAQSFTLANIVPQDRELNRGLWAAIEESVRRLALRRGTLFVITGPIYAGDAVHAINGRVLVPTQLYKALYDPATGEAGAYLAPNRDDAGWQAVSLDVLGQAAGLDLFPGLAPPAKARAMDLPEPRAYSRDETGTDERSRRRPRTDDSFEAWAKAELHRILRRLWRDLMRAIF